MQQEYFLGEILRNRYVEEMELLHHNYTRVQVLYVYYMCTYIYIHLYIYVHVQHACAFVDSKSQEHRPKGYEKVWLWSGINSKLCDSAQTTKPLG